MGKAVLKAIMTVAVLAALSMLIWKVYRVNFAETREEHVRRLRAEMAEQAQQDRLSQTAAPLEPSGVAIATPPPPAPTWRSPFVSLININTNNGGYVQPGPALGPARLLEGHGGLVHAIAFAPDGQSLASAGSDRTIRIWDPATGKQLRSLEGPEQIVTALAYSSDGKLLAEGATGGGVEIMNAQTGEIIGVWIAHPIGVHRILFLPGDKGVITSGCDGTVRTWSLDGTPQLTVAAHSDCAAALDVRPDGKQAISGSEDKSAALIDLEKGAVTRLPGVTEQVTCVQYVEGGREAVVYQLNAPDLIYDVDSAALIGQFQVGCTYAGISADRGLAACSAGSSGSIVSLPTGRFVARISGPRSPMWAIDISPDGRFVAGGGGYDPRDPNTRSNAIPTIYLWDLGAAAAPVAPGITGLASDGRGASGLYATKGGELHALAARDGTLNAGALVARGPGDVRAMAIAPDGAHAVLADADTVRVWTLPAGAEAARWPLKAGALCWLDTRTVAAAVDTHAYAWPLDGKPVDLGARKAPLMALAPVGDGDRFAAIGGKEVSVWSRSGRFVGCQFTLDRPGDGTPLGVLAAPDGKRMFVLDSVCGLLAYDVMTGRCQYQLPQANRYAAIRAGPDPDHVTLLGEDTAFLDVRNGAFEPGLAGMMDVPAQIFYPAAGRYTLATADGRLKEAAYSFPRLLPIGGLSMEISPKGDLALEYEAGIRPTLLVQDLLHDGPPRTYPLADRQIRPTNEVRPSLSMSADESAVAFALDEGAKVMNMSDGAMRSPLLDPDRALHFVALSPDASMVAACAVGRPSELELIKTTTGAKTPLPATDTVIDRLVFSPNSAVLAASTSTIASIPSDRNPGAYPLGTWLYDTHTGQQLGQFPTTRKLIATLFSPDSKLLYLLDEDGGFECVDVATASTLWQRPFPHRVARVALSPDGASLLFASPQMTLFTIATGETITGPVVPPLEYRLFFQNGVPARLSLPDDNVRTGRLAQLTTWEGAH